MSTVSPSKKPRTAGYVNPDSDSDSKMAAGSGAPLLTSFVDSSLVEGCDFPIQNLPYGVFRRSPSDDGHIGVAIGDQVLDLTALADTDLLSASMASWFKRDTLNKFMGLGKESWRETRGVLTRLLSRDEATLRDNASLLSEVLIPQSSVIMDMPAHIGDYTDFYSSREHATNMGVMLRGKDNALQPNWLWLPVGYHGRSSSVVMSGTKIRRPCGQLQVGEDPKAGATYGACKLLDFELEMAFFVGPGNNMGEPIQMTTAEDHIFGMVVLNDWSARDIQKWEYVPLGPFGSKNFGTTISPWIVTLDALEPFRCATSAGEQKDPEPLPYLQDPAYGSYDINLEVYLQNSALTTPHLLTRSNFKYLYWNIKQQLVHHTVTGCNMRPGDLLGSGTISGPERNQAGSLMELTWRGTEPIALPDGTARKFIADGDSITMKGFAQGSGYRVGFGSCEGTVLPAVPFVKA